MTMRTRDEIILFLEENDPVYLKELRNNKILTKFLDSIVTQYRLDLGLTVGPASSYRYNSYAGIALIQKWIRERRYFDTLIK